MDGHFGHGLIIFHVFRCIFIKLIHQFWVYYYHKWTWWIVFSPLFSTFKWCIMVHWFNVSICFHKFKYVFVGSCNILGQCTYRKKTQGIFNITQIWNCKLSVYIIVIAILQSIPNICIYFLKPHHNTYIKTYNIS